MSVPMIVAFPPQSYLGFACNRCLGPIRVFTIPAHLPTPRVPPLATKSVACPHCDHLDQYRGAQLTRFEDWQLIS